MKTIEQLDAEWRQAMEKRDALSRAHDAAHRAAAEAFDKWMGATEEENAAYRALAQARRATMQTPVGDA